MEINPINLKRNKMKKIFKSLFYITIMALVVISCDEDETTFNTLNYPEDAFVAVDGGDITVLESTTDPIDVYVNYSNTTAGSSSEVKVDFTIQSDNAVEGVDYTIVDNKTQLVYPVGQFVDKVTILPIDNFIEDGDKILNFTLDNSSVSLGYPGSIDTGKAIVITLTDDDCAFTFDDLDGIAWSGSDNVPASQAGPNPTQISTLFDGTNLLMNGLAFAWLTDTSYWDEVVVESEPVIVDMDPVTGEFTISEQFLANTTWNGAPQPTYSISADGQYFSCLQLMVVNYTLYQGGSVLRQFTETIEY